ncbi:MAG TPA: glutamine amidotransferase [Acidobacteriaceae bacterium]|nr:glutamine amidotransferase [Acidobacteriaceae bacterium]
MPTKTAAIIRHVMFEDLGSFAAPLAARGYALRYFEAGIDDLSPAGEADFLAVLGGPIAVYEDDRYPFLREEISLLRSRLRQARPTLGICLGAQLMAAALGQRVYPGAVKEIGWAPLTLTAAGRTSPIASLDGTHTSMLHWHGDTFDLPASATLLASTAGCQNQVFSVDRHALAFQCHPEFAARHLEQWLIGHACELAAAGSDLEQIRRETRLHGATLAEQGVRAFNAWLDALPQ